MTPDEFRNRHAIGLILTASSLILTACASSPATLLQEASAATSQTLCSKTFISGLDPQQAFELHLAREPGMSLIRGQVKTDIDTKTRTVTTRVAGQFETRSAFAAGRGCTLIHPGQMRAADLPPAPVVAPIWPNDWPDRILTDARLEPALDAAFAEPGKARSRVTQAVVIVHRGHLVAERYAEGLRPDQPLLSHSMAKSVIATLIGLMVQDGLITLDETRLFPEWTSPGDPRAAITPAHLLSMTAGFERDENIGAGRATRMWYTKPDTAAYAAELKPAHPQGQRFAYSSSSFTLLSRLVRERLGGTDLAVRDYAQTRLFGPLGITSAMLEYDAVGTPMGAQAMFATPRDYARFGHLISRSGRIGQTRLLPDGWTALNARPGTTGSPYGHGFWLGAASKQVRLPADTIMARGYLGQYIVIVPSADLVIVRMGQSFVPEFDLAGVARLTNATLTALEPKF